tara:strand:- start:660 stop:2297 length:1638 start_codon:yes stop_codon:yes gene_type:complete
MSNKQSERSPTGLGTIYRFVRTDETIKVHVRVDPQNNSEWEYETIINNINKDKIFIYFYSTDWPGFYHGETIYVYKTHLNEKYLSFPSNVMTYLKPRVNKFNLRVNKDAPEIYCKQFLNTDILKLVIDVYEVNGYFTPKFDLQMYTTLAKDLNIFFTITMKNETKNTYISFNLFYTELSSSPDDIYSIKQNVPEYTETVPERPNLFYQLEYPETINNKYSQLRLVQTEAFTIFLDANNKDDEFTLTQIDIYNIKIDGGNTTFKVKESITNFPINNVGFFRWMNPRSNLVWEDQINNSNFYKTIKHWNYATHQETFVIMTPSKGYFSGPSEIEFYMNNGPSNYPTTFLPRGENRWIGIVWAKEDETMDLSDFIGSTAAMGYLYNGGPNLWQSGSGIPEYHTLVGNSYCTSANASKYNISIIEMNEYTQRIDQGPCGVYHKISITPEWKINYFSHNTKSLDAVEVEPTYYSYNPEYDLEYLPKTTRNVSGTELGGGLNNSNKPFIIFIGNKSHSAYFTGLTNWTGQQTHSKIISYKSHNDKEPIGYE